MRLYSFVNGTYMSSIQHGIQTAHAAVDLVRLADNFDKGPKREAIYDWADNHKTIVILNAGNLAGLEDAIEHLASSNLPFMSFREDYQSLGGILTCVVAVIPPSIYDITLEDGIFGGGYRDAAGKFYDSTDVNYPLIKWLKSLRLA